MQWVFLLPDVNVKILSARMAVITLSRESTQYERQSKEERRCVHHVIATLENMVRRAGWTDYEIAEAKAKAKAKA